MKKEQNQRRRLTLRLHLDIESSSSSTAAEEVPAARPAKRKRGHWGNQYTRAKVQAGELCYICEQEPATHSDGLGGWGCLSCLRAIRQGREAHYQQGYREMRGN